METDRYTAKVDLVMATGHRIKTTLTASEAEEILHLLQTIFARENRAKDLS